MTTCACFQRAFSAQKFFIGFRALSCSTSNLKESKQLQERRVNLEEVLREAREVTTERQTPEVDLTVLRGINVKHITKETPNSALLQHHLELHPNVDGFINAIDVWKENNKIRKGHMDFIATAMKFMEPYGIEEEVKAYEKLFEAFPKDRFISHTLFDFVWPKPHPQLILALDLLTKMEEHGVIPTAELHIIVEEMFGKGSFPLKKLYRMYFWFTELKDINPYKLPKDVYKDRIEVIKAAVDRILGNNKGTEIVELADAVKVDDNVDYGHFIVSSQTNKQRDYVKLCQPESSLYVEGPIHIWINHKFEEYFVLKTGREELKTFEWTRIDADEEREGVVLAICFATPPYQQTLNRWLSYLQETNNKLKQCNVVFHISDESTKQDEHLRVSSS